MNVMVVDVDRLNALPTEEAGAAVHAELHRLHFKPSFEKGKLRFEPRLPRTHPFRAWLYEVETYMKLRCDRCGLTQPRAGLCRAYWGPWLCEACTHELGKIGGLLDQNGWPEIPTRVAA